MKLFLLPHQDDEVFALSMIQSAREQNEEVVLCFLTDGSAYGVDTEIRNKESLAALQEWGISATSIYFLGSEMKILDGRLSNALPVLFKTLRERFQKIDDIFVTAWEGGHPDHDAAFLLGLTLCNGDRKKVKVFFTYNGYKTFSLFFRVIAPLKDLYTVQRHKLSLKIRFKILWTIRCYKSQAKSWLGLLPQTAFHFLFLGREEIGMLKNDFQLNAPHLGRLLYERWGRTDFSDFKQSVLSFFTNEYQGVSSTKG